MQQALDNKKNIGGGLNSLPKDERDFSLAGTFSLPKLSDIPESFMVATPLEIKDQLESDMCTAFSTVSVSEDQEGVRLSPEYQFAKIKEIEGNLYGYGSDLRSAVKSATKYGSLPYEKAKEIGMTFPEKDRDFLADINNWPKSFDEIAEKHKKATYFKVDGKYDVFDNIRASLWQHREEKRSIVTGALWRYEWSGAEMGIIPETYSTENGFGHAFKLIGVKRIYNEPYLVAQLSNGKEFGDSGLFYFPRKVVNKEFKFGNFMFKDMPKEEAKKMQRRSFFSFIEDLFINLIT